MIQMFKCPKENLEDLNDPYFDVHIDSILLIILIIFFIFIYIIKFDGFDNHNDLDNVDKDPHGKSRW